jgi:phospholipid/cholesterol/gamma-HCH transport system substrate-binding protein
MRRVRTRGLSNATVGIIAVVVTVIVTYLGFTKAIPFKHHYEVKAVFKTANNLRPNSKVRIAGVDVGKVTDVQHLRNGEPEAIVTMRIDKNGLPLHKDAHFAIRPRIFLEGNFFVDVQPGTPNAPTIHDGETFPVNQTKTPVQFDQLLTALQTDTRSDLRVLLQEYGRAVARGGPGYNRSIKYWKPAYKNSAIVNDATLGLLQHDLSGYVKNAGATAQALDRNPEQLKSLITDFNTTAAAFSADQTALENTVAELPRTLRAASPALKSLNDSFPSVRRFARDFDPGVRSSLPALKASIPFVKQVRGLVSKPELRGLVSDLRPTVPSLASLQNSSVPLQQQVRAASSCQNEVILPWSNDKIQDPSFPANGPVYQESVKWLPGIAGESRSGDPNGPWVRVLLNSPNFIYPAGEGRFFGTTAPLQGVNPPKPVDQNGNIRYPPYRADVPCETQQPPDLRTTALPPPQGRAVPPPSTPAEIAEYDKAKAAAVDWLRTQLKDEGLTKQFKVSDVDLKASQLPLVAAQAKREAAAK